MLLFVTRPPCERVGRGWVSAKVTPMYTRPNAGSEGGLERGWHGSWRGCSGRSLRLSARHADHEEEEKRRGKGGHLAPNNACLAN